MQEKLKYNIGTVLGSVLGTAFKQPVQCHDNDKIIHIELADSDAAKRNAPGMITCTQYKSTTDPCSSRSTGTPLFGYLGPSVGAIRECLYGMPSGRLREGGKQVSLDTCYYGDNFPFNSSDFMDRSQTGFTRFLLHMITAEKERENQTTRKDSYFPMGPIKPSKSKKGPQIAPS